MAFHTILVWLQAEQLDSISSMTVEAAENVIEGNEQIKGVSVLQCMAVHC